MNTLTVLRDEEDFFDVTLAVDGKQLRAHKLILSACSFFFRRLLKLNPAPNPVIGKQPTNSRVRIQLWTKIIFISVLWDVSYDDMVNLIDFMYHGEVKVKHANIQNFLAVAEKFRVRGLCQNDSSGGPSSPKSPESQNQARQDSSQTNDLAFFITLFPRLGWWRRKKQQKETETQLGWRR